MSYILRVPEDIAVRVDAEVMGTLVEAMFKALGAPDADAKRSADVLMYADVRGIDTHGASNMMRAYVAWMKAEFVNPAPVMKIVREAPAVATVDSDGGLGLTVGPQAMALAIQKARECGVGSVSVTNGRHYGAAAYYAAMALDEDMIGVSMTTGGIYTVPTFGSKAMVGANPIALAAPSRNEAPFVFDASFSSVAVNKITIAKRLGATIPGGWITDLEGTPIMEEGPVPKEFLMAPMGSTREMGSHKGYGLCVMVDILCGLLSGNPAGFLRTPGDASHHFLAYRIDAFTDLESFKDEMDVYLKGLRETPPAPGHERVFYAGLPEHETEIERRAKGIPYHPEVIEWYKKTAEELGVEHRLP